MNDLKTYIAAQGNAVQASEEELEALVVRYAWFTPARILLARRRGSWDERLRTLAAARAIGPAPEVVDAHALTCVTPDDVIDRFLRQTDLRIVVREDDPPEEISTEAELGEEDVLVSEELAEVYLAQGLRSEALAIYRQLSLLNPEKSVYFAEIIRKMETNN